MIGEHTSSRDCTGSFETQGPKKIGMLSSIGAVVHNIPFTYPKLGFFSIEANPGRGKTTTIKNVVFKDFPDPSTLPSLAVGPLSTENYSYLRHQILHF